MERSKELSFSVRYSGDAGQPTGLVGSTPGFVGDLQLLAGEELDARLQVHDRIGGGSSARVYRGTLDGTTPVAIKVLHPHAAQRESTLQEFLREAQVLARLQHKHIVRLHALAHLPPNFGGLPTRRFTWGIVTELMEAGTLTKLIQDGARVHKQQQRIKQQLAAAAMASVGGASSAAPDRSNSLRQLKHNLSFLRRRSQTPAAAGDGGTAPASPRNRPSAAAVAVSPGGGAAVGSHGLSARLDSVTMEMPSLPYSDKEALHWCMEVALALQFLHAQTPPVVHRDVKTDNVLMAAVALPSMPQPSALRAGTDLGMSALGSSFTGMGVTGGGMNSGTGGEILNSHGSLVRRVLSVRAAAALAGEGGISRAGSVSMAIRPGGGRPLTAKVCDFGLHVVLDMSRPVVTVRRRSYEHNVGGEPLVVGGPGGSMQLPYSSSLTRRSARQSPTGGSAAGSVPCMLLPQGPSGASMYGMGPPSPLAALHSSVMGMGMAGGAYLQGAGMGGGGGMDHAGRYEARSRRSSLMSTRAPEDAMSLFRRAVSRDGDSFSRNQPNYQRKNSSLSHTDSLEPSNPHAAAQAAANNAAGNAMYSSSPPKPLPFAGGAAAAAAAAAAFGTNAAMVGGITRPSIGPSAPPMGGLLGSGGGAYRSPKISGPGSGPGPPKWSGGSARVLQQQGEIPGFAATRASLDMLLQGRMSTAAMGGLAAHTSGMMAAGGTGLPAGTSGGGGTGSGAALGTLAPLHSSLSHQLVPGGGIESMSAGQMMIQLQGVVASSTTGMSERGSRLRPSHAGPSTGELALPAGLTLEAALRMSNRSSSGRPSAATAAALAAAGGGTISGSGADSCGPLSAPGQTRAPRPSGGSPATSSRGGTRLRSNAAQVEKYLAMMEEDLNLDITSRSSSKAQAEMEPLYGSHSRNASIAAPNARSAAGSGLVGASGGGGRALATLSTRRLLSPGHSQGNMPGGQHGPHVLQGTFSSASLDPAGAPRVLPPQPQLGARPSLTAIAVASGADPTPMAPSPNSIAPRRTEATGSGSGAAAAGAGLVRRTASVGPYSPEGHAAAMRPPSATSTRSDQGMIVLTGGSYSGVVDPSGCNATGSGSGNGRMGPPPYSHGAHLAAGGAAAGGALQRAPVLARGPNPMKSSSQPAMSVSGNALAGPYVQEGVAVPGQRHPNPIPMKSSSQPVMNVSERTMVGMSWMGEASGSHHQSSTVPAAAATGGPPLPRGKPHLAMSTSQLTEAAGASGASSPGQRGPNPMKSSSQPVMNLAAMAMAAGSNSSSPRLSVVSGSPGHRGPNPSKSSSQPTMLLAAASSGSGAAPSGAPSMAGSAASRGRDGGASAAAAVLMRTTSNGSRGMSHLGLGVGGNPASPTSSVHAMDLSPPAHRVKSTRMAPTVHHLGGTIPEAEGELLDRQGSVSTRISSDIVPPARRTRQPLEVTLPVDACGTDGALETASSGGGGASSASASAHSHAHAAAAAAQGPRVGSSGGDVGSSAFGAGRLWVATVTAAASPRTHSPAAAGVAAGISPVGTDSGSLPIASQVAAHTTAPVVLNRELHKVVKRLRPDGGGSFTGTSPLGLPPTVHSGSGAAAGGGGRGPGEGGSFTYSRRSSMDSHAPSYTSIGSARSATAALLAAGGGGHGGGSGTLASIHREKMLWGRGLLVVSNSAGQSSGGGGAFGNSGPVPAALISDPNSPVSSYGPVPGSGRLLGRPAPKLPGLGPPAAMGAMGMGVGGAPVPRTTSGGASASGNSGRQSSAGERSARQSSLIRHSSSTHSNTAASWADGGAHALAGVASGAASPSRANTGASLRIIVAGGGSVGAISVLPPPPSGHTPSALASPMLAHVTGAGSQTSSTMASLAARNVSESAVSSNMGGWTGRDELPPQGEAAYALTGRAGTLLYMAPEVIRHEPYNEKVDVFSFGVVLYEVFGRVLLLELYSKDELEALSGRIAQGFRHHRPDCMPQAVWDLVQQCWAQNPADRPSMPLVVRQMELALEAMDEAEAAAVVTASGTHRAGSLFGEGTGGTLSLAAPGSPMALTGGGTAPGSTATGPKERSSGRSLASQKSIAAVASLGRRSRGISFRRRPTVPRSQPQPTAPTPGRQPPAPANLSGPEFPRAISAASGLQSLISRGSPTTGLDSPSGQVPEPRCGPCGCVIC